MQTASYPRCGHLIHQHVTEQELKTLSAASHAEIQRGRNFFASGMSLNLIGAIILVLAIIFLVLAHKPANNFALVTTCPEFFVCVADCPHLDGQYAAFGEAADEDTVRAAVRISEVPTRTLGWYDDVPVEPVVISSVRIVRGETDG